jgi:hypothetical protein
MTSEPWVRGPSAASAFEQRSTAAASLSEIGFQIVSGDMRN